jgi:hypothetical protein
VRGKCAAFDDAARRDRMPRMDAVGHFIAGAGYLADDRRCWWY